MPFRVLIVEDNPITTKLFRLCLELEGYEVVCAENGAEAVSMAQALPPDLVLMDLVLPDNNGLAVAELIRALPGQLATPIIACTGFRSDMDLSRIMSAGLNDVLVKPVEPSQLAQTVAAYLPRALVGALPRAGRILLVDDDPVQLKLGRVLLSQLGQDVTTAAGGAEALLLAQTSTFTAIVSDVLMPEMDGFQLCSELRRMPGFEAPPIVLVSNAYAQEADRELAASVGADALVERTPDYAEVIAVLGRDLQGERPAPHIGVEDLSTRYIARLVAQLDRQSSMNVGLARRAALQGATVAVLSAITDVFVHEEDIGTALDTVLAHVVNAAGISRALLLTPVPGGGWTCTAQLGYGARSSAELQSLFGAPELLGAVASGSGPVSVPGPVSDELAGLDFAKRLEAETALIFPLATRFGCLGILVLASASRDLVGNEWRAFSDAVASELARALTMKELFERQAASERRYRTVMTEASDAILLLGEEGQIVEVNRQTSQFLGIEPAAFEGVAFDSVFATAATNQEDHGEAILRTLRRDGTALALAAVRTPVSFDGKPHTLVMARDVTQRDALEAERANTVRAEATAEARAQFISRLSHDLSTPLTVVLGFSEMLRSSSLGAEDAEAIDHISAAALHARDLVEETLNLTRISEGRVSIQLERVNVKEMLTRLSAFAKPLARAKHLRVEIGDLDDSWAVLADRTRLRECLLNLVSNAAKYNCEAGTVRLWCETGDGEGTLRLGVADTGRGIAREQLNHLFHPFERLGVTDIEGTGLGLATCRELVAAMGGTVGFESELGRGSKFWIELPRDSQEH